jgi:ubiquinone/menaquinone biosynthesis C-methylase UbiE
MPPERRARFDSSRTTLAFMLRSGGAPNPRSMRISADRDRSWPDPIRKRGQAALDYDLSYRDVFWLTRAYEDEADRLAIRALIPRTGNEILDLGAGFGRLTSECLGYRAITLVDTSPTMLSAAAERWSGGDRIRFVRASADALPFPDSSFDAVISVRMLVHVADPRHVFEQVRRVLRPGGSFVVEFPNRRHVLAIARYLARQQTWSPWDPAPHEYLAGHFAHHPARLIRQLGDSGLVVDAVRAASILRSSWLKRHTDLAHLVKLEASLQRPLGPLFPSPSVYLRTRPSDRATISRIDTSS